MIKDVMVWLDGSLGDEVRLEAGIATQFESQVIALVLNPMLVPIKEPLSGALTYAELLEAAREVGDQTEEKLVKRLEALERPVEIRRFDVLADDVANIAAREARAADTFVALRPNGALDPDRLIEGVLFASGRNLYLFPETQRPKIGFDHVLVPWNGSRELARAMAEGMPFLHKAKTGYRRGRDRSAGRGTGGGDRRRRRQSSGPPWYRCRALSHQKPQQRCQRHFDRRGLTPASQPHGDGGIWVFSPARMAARRRVLQSYA